MLFIYFFFFSSRRRHTRYWRDWSSDVCSSDLAHTLLGPDVPSNVSSSDSTPDGLLTLTGYADTPGTVPANLYGNVDWLGISGGNNNEAVEGAESLNLQFSALTGLSGIATRYTSGQVVLSGFTADPG